MRKYMSRMVFVFACVATGALGDVNMTLTGPPPGPSMGGAYTSPYTADIDGVSTLVICDDFNSDVYQGLNWSATATPLDTLTGGTASSTVKFDQGGNAVTQQFDYTVVAYLAMELMQVDQSTTSGQTEAGELSYAIWDVFDPNADMTAPLPLTSSELAAIGNPADGYTSGFLYDAEQAVTGLGLTPVNFAAQTGWDVTIYTPTSNQNFTQEFITATDPVPEPPGPALLGVYLVGLPGLFLFFRRRALVR